MNAPNTMSHTDRACRLLSLCLAGVVSFLSAQSTPPASPGEKDVVTLSAFEVTDRQDHGYTSTNAVGGTRFNTAIVNIPQTVIVLNQDFLKDLGARSVIDAAQYVSGVSDTAGPGRDVFNVRGYQVGVTTDGLPDDSPTAQSITAPFELIDRVEIIKGPAAVLYGSTSPGGNANRVTKKPLFHDQMDISASIGTGGYYYGAFDVNQTSKAGDGDFAIRVMGSHEHFDKYINYPDSSTWFISPAFSWRMSPRTTLTVVPYYYERNHHKKFATLFQFRPYTAEGPISFNLPRDVDWGGQYAREKFDVRRLYATLDHQISDNWSLRFSAVGKTHDEYNNDIISRDLLNDNRTMQRTWRIVTTQSDYKVAAFDSLISFDLGPTKNKTLFLAQYSDQEVTAQTNTGRKLSGQQTALGENANNTFSNLPLIDVYNPDPAALGARPDSIYLSASTRSLGDVSAASLQHQIEMLDGRLIGNLGLRLDRTHAEGYNVMTNARTSTGSNRHYTKRAGAVYRPTSGLSVFFNYSETFAPVFRVNPDGSGFKPTEGLTNEIGIKTDLMEGRISGTASAFKVVNKNLLVISNDPLLASAGYFEQSAKDELTGVEFDVHFNPSVALQMFASYSTIATTNANGLRVRKVPANTWALFTSYKLPRGWTVGGGVRYKGEQPGDAGNVFYLDPSTVGDAFVSYKHSEKLKLYLNVTNITDKFYATSSINRNLIFPGPERRIRLSVDYTF